jgi:hypothetical protein
LDIPVKDSAAIVMMMTITTNNSVSDIPARARADFGLILLPLYLRVRLWLEMLSRTSLMSSALPNDPEVIVVSTLQTASGTMVFGELYTG